MSDKTLLLPSESYNPAHERSRNRRIEEVMRRSEMGIRDTIYQLFAAPCLVSELPPLRMGARGFVTDATSSTFYAPLVGGGTVHTTIFHDGTIWRVG